MLIALLKKKLFVSIGATGISLLFLPLLAAFEAHVVNVTAHIEHALRVDTRAINFGTVFPQEHLEKSFAVAFSQSFIDENRVDNVSYIIRQKPKCGVTTLDGTQLVEGSTKTGHVEFSRLAPERYTIDCGGAPIPFDSQTHTYGILPSLCEYISKEPDQEIKDDGTKPSFHKPFRIAGRRVQWDDTFGFLSKGAQDLIDNWTIDLAVPCFGNHCAQDWADFVHSINPIANPDDYIQQPSNEHKIFGCDLWVEVTGVSEEKPITYPTNHPQYARIRPIRECVIENGPNDYTAYFGYENLNDYPVIIAIGAHNKFTGGGTDDFNQGQSIVFDHPNVEPNRPGRTGRFPNAAFRVDFNGTAMTWTLNNRTATATTNSPRCAD